jgi:two-component system, cell cycle sensor histidine kinase DivJ
LLATALAVLNSFMLVRSLSQAIQSEKTNTREQRIVGNEIGDIVSETVVAADSSGNILRVSRNCERLLGLSPVTLLGKGLLELVLVSDRPAFLSALAQAATGDAGKTVRLRVRHGASSGLPSSSGLQNSSGLPSYRWVELSAQSSASAGQPAVATLRDVDAQVIEEEGLVRTAAQAEIAKKSQAAFLATVNHELRTPLNAIIGFSDVLAQPLTMPSDPERVADYARIIHGAGHDLLRMITTMIDITRLDSGVYEFETEMQNVHALVTGTIDSFGKNPENAKVKFEISHEMAAYDMSLDARVVRSIMLQLLSNAVKFGKGGVQVSTRLHKSQFEICIKDCGQGIAADKLDLIGRTFGRLDDAMNRERSGLGLGLSLANGLARLHGGSIRIESEPGKGTAVTLCLPVGEPEPIAQLNNITALPKRAAATHTLQPIRKSRRRHG